MSKTIALAFILVLATSSLLIVGSSSEQSMPKPSIPEFTVQLIDNSYDVPATQTIDPYTGQKITNPSHHVESKTIEIKITNQRNDYTIYYSVNMKGHFEKNWTSIYSTWDRMEQSDSQFTIFNFKPPVASGQIDFQVEAVAGYWSQGDVTVPGVPRGDVFTGEKSGWSNTQTIAIPETSSTSSNPTPTPTVPEFSLSAVLCLLVALPLITVFLRERKIKI